MDFTYRLVKSIVIDIEF